MSARFRILFSSFLKLFPFVRQELINLGYWCCRQTGKCIFKIIERIYFKSAACVNESHPGSSGMSVFNRAGKEPVAATKNSWSQSVFGRIIVAWHKAGISIQAKCIPLILQVSQAFAQRSFRQNALSHRESHAINFAINL
jgi:hypothetical protein